MAEAFQLPVLSEEYARNLNETKLHEYAGFGPAYELLARKVAESRRWIFVIKNPKAGVPKPKPEDCPIKKQVDAFNEFYEVVRTVELRILVETVQLRINRDHLIKIKRIMDVCFNSQISEFHLKTHRALPSNWPSMRGIFEKVRRLRIVQFSEEIYELVEEVDYGFSASVFSSTCLVELNIYEYDADVHENFFRSRLPSLKKLSCTIAGATDDDDDDESIEFWNYHNNRRLTSLAVRFLDACAINMEIFKYWTNLEELAVKLNAVRLVYDHNEPLLVMHRLRRMYIMTDTNTSAVEILARLSNTTPLQSFRLRLDNEDRPIDSGVFNALLRFTISLSQFYISTELEKVSSRELIDFILTKEITQLWLGCELYPRTNDRSFFMQLVAEIALNGRTIDIFFNQGLNPYIADFDQFKGAMLASGFLECVQFIPFQERYDYFDPPWTMYDS